MTTANATRVRPGVTPVVTANPDRVRATGTVAAVTANVDRVRAAVADTTWWYLGFKFQVPA